MLFPFFDHFYKKTPPQWQWAMSLLAFLWMVICGLAGIAVLFMVLFFGIQQLSLNGDVANRARLIDEAKPEYLLANQAKNRREWVIKCVNESRPAFTNAVASNTVKDCTASSFELFPRVDGEVQ